MTRRLRSTALVLALAAVPALGSAAPAQGAAPLEVAIQDDPVFLGQDYLRRPKGFALAKELHASWLKVNVSWSSAAGRNANRKSKPSSVKYDFTPYDGLINSAASNGVQLQLSLTGPAPRWATGDKRKIGPYKPNATYYKDFVRQAVSHFKDTIGRYSIWNEPNYVGWIAPLSSAPKIYRSLYVTGYKEIRRIDPSAQILIGETSPYALRGRATAPLAFLRAVAKSGTLHADGFAHHPYDFDHAPTFNYPGKDNVTLSGLSRLTKALDGLAARNRLSDENGAPLDLWLTEYGYFRSGKRKTKESTRAKYVRKGFDMALAHPRVHQMLHYLLAQPTSRYLFFDTSITSRSGGRTATFNALADWADDNLGSLAP
ncbi:MAG TPA: hypothetical protein VF520_14315 [Thermoleophilaceae bacterium]|jgi:hypothetical protein